MGNPDFRALRTGWRLGACADHRAGLDATGTSPRRAEAERVRGLVLAAGLRAWSRRFLAHIESNGEIASRSYPYIPWEKT